MIKLPVKKRYFLDQMIREFTQLDIQETSKNELMEDIIEFFTE